MEREASDKTNEYHGVCWVLTYRAPSAEGSNLRETASLVSVELDSYFHCFTAFSAAGTKIGLPPSVSIFATEPEGFTTATSRTIPPIPFDFNSTGYSGMTRWTILRRATCCNLAPATELI